MIYGNRVQKFNSNGDYLGQWGVAGQGDGEFNSVVGIAADTYGNIYTAEQNGKRIQKFRYADTTHTNGNSIITVSPYASIDTHNVIAASAAGTQDDAYEYPLGLMNYAVHTPFDDAPEITLLFKTNLNADQVTLRRYTGSGYETISGPVITEKVINGTRYLEVRFTAHDGGAYDDDATVNGTITGSMSLGVARAGKNGDSSIMAPHSGLDGRHTSVIIMGIAVIGAVIVTTQVLRKKRR